jgi:flagellar hook protein FlgE
MAISSNVSSIQAHQTVMNNNAHNVANVNTDRFVPQETTLTEGAEDSVQANTDKATDNGSTTSQTDLSKELTEQVEVERAVEANVSAIRTQDEMFGSLLDITV